MQEQADAGAVQALAQQGRQDEQVVVVDPDLWMMGWWEVSIEK